MSRRARSGAVLAVAVGLAWSGAGAAQEAEAPSGGPAVQAQGATATSQDAAERAARRRALEARIPELDRRWRTLDARAREAAAREAVRPSPSTPLDTLDLGRIRVVSALDDAERARRVWRDAWAEYAPLVPPASGLDGHTFVFQVGRETPIRLGGESTPVQVGVPWVPVRDAPVAARRALGQRLEADLPRALREWVGGGALMQPDWTALHRELALSPRSAARACFEQGGEACRLALGVDPGAEEALLEALAPGEARALVGGLAPPEALATSPVGPAALRCLEGDAQSCVDVLRGVPDRLPPLSRHARAGLLWLALERGGADGVARAGEAGDPASALALLGGEGLDTLVEAWREQVLAHRPTRADEPRRRSLAVAWLAAFAFLATRSTRWRFP